jgi:hypothetical protein
MPASLWKNEKEGFYTHRSERFPSGKLLRGRQDYGLKVAFPASGLCIKKRADLHIKRLNRRGPGYIKRDSSMIFYGGFLRGVKGGVKSSFKKIV